MTLLESTSGTCKKNLWSELWSLDFRSLEHPNLSKFCHGPLNFELSRFTCILIISRWSFKKMFQVPLTSGLEYSLDESSILWTEVQKCPDGQKAWDTRAELKKCSTIERYHCLVNGFGNCTVEGCAKPALIQAGWYYFVIWDREYYMLKSILNAYIAWIALYQLEG
jgi:hypothetical protein